MACLAVLRRRRCSSNDAVWVGNACAEALRVSPEHGQGRCARLCRVEQSRPGNERTKRRQMRCGQQARPSQPWQRAWLVAVQMERIVVHKKRRQAGKRKQQASVVCRQEAWAHARVAICSSVGPAGHARTRRNTCRALPCLVVWRATLEVRLRRRRRASVSPPQRFMADSLNAKVIACRSPRHAVDAASVSCNVALLPSTCSPPNNLPNHQSASASASPASLAPSQPAPPHPAIQPRTLLHHVAR